MTLGTMRRFLLGGSQTALLGALVLVLWSPLRQPEGLVELQPETWVHEQPWSMGPYIEGWDEISHGKWVVLLYGSQCRACTATRDDYENLAETWRGQKSPIRIALIDTMADVADPLPADATGPNAPPPPRSMGKRAAGTQDGPIGMFPRPHSFFLLMAA